jgi:hypothetical protein
MVESVTFFHAGEMNPTAKAALVRYLFGTTEVAIPEPRHSRVVSLPGAITQETWSRKFLCAIRNYPRRKSGFGKGTTSVVPHETKSGRL